MKIKEVIEQTGLTDRAIRLYIEYGLVAPENQKSYSGRNNYNFTQADTAVLEQIALLRKADFSLEQIRALQSGGEAAQEALQTYLSAKREAVETGQKIVAVLENFPAQEPVTLESICARIKESMENAPLPEADRKETTGERVEKWLMRIAAVILLGYCGLLALGAWVTYREDFVLPRFYRNPANYIGTAYIVIPILLSLTVLFLYRKHALFPKKRKKRRWIAGAVFGTALLILLQPIGPAALMLIPPVYSETEDPDNYLTMDRYVKMHSEDIYKLFPAMIPRSAIAKDSNWYPEKFPDTTKYYYYFQDVVDPSFQLYAEWVLPKKEFTEELTRIQNYYPEGTKQQAQWGDWVCLSFTEDTLDFEEAKDLIDYYYLIFAYNEKTRTVRYIASYSMDCGREEDPYFVALQWE